jgi:soluble lytic murein transglycosylase-like protein
MNYLPLVEAETCTRVQVSEPTAIPTVELTGKIFPVKPKAPDCQVSQSFPANILQWCSLVTNAGRKYHVDPNLIAAVMLQESGGDRSAYSRSGAVGLMQVMPRDGIATGFKCINGPCFVGRPTIAELQDPSFNLDYATKMLAGLISRYGNTRDALKAYGPSGGGYYYADKVLGIYRRYGGNK